MSKAAEKRAEKLAFEERIKVTLEKAHAAAKVAFEDFSSSAKKDSEGRILDSCGGAFVVVYKPSYRLRISLQGLNEIEKGHRGAWHVSNFTKCVPSQSITANERAANAACEVLRSEFGEADGSFFASSYID